MRQSMPSNNIDSCTGVTLNLPSLVAGQMKRPLPHAQKECCVSERQKSKVGFVRDV
jgi:hypothetical protein